MQTQNVYSYYIISSKSELTKLYYHCELSCCDIVHCNDYFRRCSYLPA